MVSRKQHLLSTSGFIVTGMFAILAQVGFAENTGKKFFADDPLWREPEPRSSGKIEVRKVDDIYDFLENTYVTPRQASKRGPAPAQGVNTLGEVPDTAWYTNRHWRRRMSIQELTQGPGNSTPPDAKNSWKVVSAKSDGVTPGFVIE